MEKDRQPPDPHARGARLLPPSLPPAPPSGGNLPPPGSGWGGAAGEPSPRSGRLFDALVECVEHIAVIRTTLETCAVFPDDLELRREMAPIIRDASDALARRLQETRCRLTENPGWVPQAELVSFRRLLLEPAFGRALGIVLPLLNRAEFVRAVTLPPAAFAELVLGHVQDAAAQAFEDGTVEEFDARLGRPFELLLHAATFAGIVP